MAAPSKPTIILAGCELFASGREFKKGTGKNFRYLILQQED